MSFEEEVDEIEAETILGGAPFFSRPGGKIFIIWLVFTVIGVLIGVYAPHHLLPVLHSPEGGDVWATVVVFTVLAAPVAALVYAIAFYSLFAWRHRSNDPDEPPPDAEPQRGNGPITVIWLTVSTLLVVVLLFELPVNRPVQFNVTSVDVTHGFWPAALGVQVDANPNVVTVIRTTPNTLGSFIVQCSQLCGLYHAFMNNNGDVVTTQQFDSWLQSNGATPTAAAAAAGVTAPCATAQAESSSWSSRRWR